jgi:DNA polymerase-3 subunit gamma/tau
MARSDKDKSPEGATRGTAEAASTALGVSYVPLARKYRPQAFPELIGQEAMVQTLRNAFASGRIAQAYMLTGVRGVGKTTTARLIARALNYAQDGTETGPTLDMESEGVHCRAILESRHLDVVEMDAASHTGIDDVRDLIDSAHYKPNTARYKVYIVDEVHMLSKQAFNGLLKTLEEPPPHVKFIFATTEARKVPVTVLSRCQRFDLKRIEVEELADHLAGVVAKEGGSADRAALMLIARAAEGSVRDALSVLDRALAFGSGALTAADVRGLLGLADASRIYDLLETVLSGDAGKALAELAALNRDGAEPGQIVADLADAVHAVTRVKAAGAESADPAASEAERSRAAELAARLSMPVLSRAWQMLLKGYDEVRSSPRPLAAADMILVRLAYAADLPPPGELARALGGDAASGSRAPDRKPQSQTPPPPPKREPVSSSEPKAEPPQAEQPPPREDDPAPAVELTFFDDVVALAEAKRDLKLKNALMEQVRLIHFKPGNIEFSQLPAAPRDLSQELMRKLKLWTGRVWIVAVSDKEGQTPLGQQRREREARELEIIKQHPAVKEVLQHFPDARIAAVRATEPAQDPAVDAAPEDDMEDGTNR